VYGGRGQRPFLSIFLFKKILLGGGEMMNQIIALIISSTFFLLIILLSVPLTFAQFEIWDSVSVSAYGTDVDEFGSYFTFTVVAPPQGSEITNVINMSRVGGENYTFNCSPGDLVAVWGQDVNIMEIMPASEPNHFTIIFEGTAQNVNINNANIPEFPPIFAVPLFMTATFLAIIYRRKRISQTKSAD
jgi:hypothetical protein